MSNDRGRDSGEQIRTVAQMLDAVDRYNAEHSYPKLKPCPFCKGRAEYAETTQENAGGLCATCTKCNACSAVVFGDKEDPHAHVAFLWNRRASRPSPDKKGEK